MMPRVNSNRPETIWMKKPHLHPRLADRYHHLLGVPQIPGLRIYHFPFLSRKYTKLLIILHPLLNLPDHSCLQFRAVEVNTALPANNFSVLITFIIIDHDSEVLRNDDIAEETPRRSKPPPPRRQSTDTSRDNASVSISPQRKSSGTHAISPSTVSLSHSHYYDSEILDEEQGGKPCQFH